MGLCDQWGSTRRLITALLTERDYRLLPRAEVTNALDLSEYEDFDHVLRQTSITPGRHPDPLEPEHIYHALIEPDLSLNELYRRFSVGRTKAKAIKSFAHAILSFMQQDGYSIYRPESGTERNKIPDFVS